MRSRSRPYGAAVDVVPAVVRLPRRLLRGESKWDGYHERTLIMRKFAQSVVNFMKREDGPTAVEYAVMLALIIVVCITAITAIGTNANKTFQNVADNLTTAS
jgi:pilus assembly protein Flp/PilA